MNAAAPIVGGIVYFILGAVWFTPLFGKAWDKAVGFSRPVKWRPPASYYLGPLVGCIVISLAINYLATKTGAKSLADYAALALICGAGFSAAVTTVNAISPNVPKPYLYSAVVGGYHIVGAVLSAIAIYLIKH